MRFGGLTAVEGVDCAVDERQIVSIIGPNGAGKTTVFNAITGIYEPTSGSIEFRGKQLAPLADLAGAGGMCPVGLLTGLVAGLVSVDVNALWRATIKRNYAGPGEPFSYCRRLGKCPRTICAASWRSIAFAAAAGPSHGRRPPHAGLRRQRKRHEKIRERFEQLTALADSSADVLDAERWASGWSAIGRRRRGTG